ncbi:hypothetical protein ACHWQZ_G009142 [Mnemiopsis leidyi]
MDQECEVKHFQFKFLPKINVSGHTDIERGNLLSSTKFGHVIVSHGTNVLVYKKSDIHSTFVKEKASACVAGPQKASVMTFDSRVTHLAISCDNLILSVVTDDNKISLVDVRTLDNEPAVFSQANMSAKCSGMMWNPAIPTLLASATVTGEVTMWEVRGDVLVQASTKQTFGASSLCWSSKGKQLAVGTNDGKIFNLKPTLDEARCTLCPPLFKDQTLVRDIFWISTFEYVAVYESNDTIKVVHVQNQKDKKIPTNFTDFDDIFYTEPGRAIAVLFSQILPWNTLLLGCSRGIELGVIGEVPGKQGQFLFNLDEGARAEMPFQDGEPSYPVGMCVDYNFNHPTIIGEKSIDPSPVLMTLTSEGVLCSFKLLNLNVTTGLVSPLEHPAVAPPSRTKSIVNVKKTATSAPVSAPAAKPSLFAPSSAAPFPSLGVPGLASTPTAAATSFSAPFSTQKRDSTPSLTAGFPTESKPATSVLTKPETAKHQEVKVVKEPLSRKPSLPISSTPLEKPVAVEKKKDSQENQANLDSIFAKSIDEEVKNFSYQLEQHKLSSNRLEDVKDILSKDELKDFSKKIANLEKKLKKLHSMLDTVNKDVSGEKDTLLVALASLEEAKGYYNCYNDPSYIALLKSKPLDKMTRKLKDDLYAKFAQMQNLIDELNIQLDTEWENMHSNKKTTPTSRMIYKTLSQHRTISNEQEKTVDTLLKQLGNLTLKPKEDSPLKSKPVTANAKTISPQKQKMLRGIFENRMPKSKVVTSPAKLSISSFSTSYSKPPFLPPMSEKGEPEDSDTEKENKNLNSAMNNKPDQMKMGIPTLTYSEKPKFDLDDPTRLLDGDEKVPTVVLKYMPSTPQVVPSAEEKAKGAQELVSKLMDFAQKEKDSGPGNTDSTFAQKFVPVMRTKGPVAPGQAPNAVIQPLSAVSESTVAPQKSSGLFGAPAAGTSFSLTSGSPQTSSLFGLPKTQSTSPQNGSNKPEPSGLFSFASTPQTATKTPVVDAKTMFGAQPPAQSTGSLFAPVSTPPLNAAQIGAKTTPILVTPKATTPPQANIFGTLKPTAELPKSPGGDSFPVFGVPASQFDKERESPATLPDYNESSEESSTTSLASSKTDTKVGSSIESSGQDKTSEDKIEPTETKNIFAADVSKPTLFSSSADASKNLFAAAPSSGNIFAMASSSSSGGNIFTSSSSSGNLFGSGGSTAGFFAPVSKATDDHKKESSPSIGGSLVSSQEKSPATPPQTAPTSCYTSTASPPKATLSTTETTPQTTTNVFAVGGKEQDKPLSAKNLFGADAKENEGEGGLFGLKISSDDAKTSTPPKNPFVLSDTKAASPASESSGLFGSKPASTNSPFTSNLFGKPAGGAGVFSSSAAPASTSEGSGTAPASGGLFGSTTTTSSGLFGSTPPTVSDTTSASAGLFGAATTAGTTASPGGGLFGSVPASTASSGLFGSAPASTASSGLFGSVPASTASSGLFGSAPASTASSGLFGSAPASTASSGLFGSAPASTASSGLFGSAPASTASSGLFGSAPASTASSGLFGSAPASTASSGLFGSAPASTASSGLFGSTTTTSSSGLFGNTSSTPSSGLFGSAAPSEKPSPFTSTQSSGMFGASTTGQSGSMFGGSTGGGFGTTPSGTSAGGFGGGNASGGVFGNSQSQPGFGGNNSSSQSAFGGAPAFGTAPAFGSTPSFGSGPAFGSTPSFGSSGGFGAPAASGFGSQPAFGSQASGGGSVFGAGSGSVFGGGSGGGVSFGGVAASGGGGIFGSNSNNNAPTGFGAVSNQNSGGFLGNSNTNNTFNNKPSSFSSWR